ncbi:MAG TPA: Crp/Fnr family transcriptional regulator [Candidatus Binatia bacterium]|nr:Crp/Fnr family transcriptional regulator [Candidatus Binatia bacterium]
MANRLLATLDAGSRNRLRALMEPVSFESGATLARAGEPVTYSYFVASGMISMVKTMKSGRAVEIAAVGREGMAPLAATLNFDRAVFDSVVQIRATGFRIAQRELWKSVAQNAEFDRTIHAYGEVAMAQLARTAACNILHSVKKRCCRWLLTAHDNAESDVFPLTHEYLALMLGVRRAAVSLAAESLQRAGLIEYCHGKMTVKNRPALERAACECYAAGRAELDKLFSTEQPA